jgi:proline dehydrogenase
MGDHPQDVAAKGSREAIAGGMVARQFLLWASRNAALNRFMAARGLQLGAARFVAGETLADFVEHVKRLNAGGFEVASAILGEGVVDEAATKHVVEEYCALLRRIATENLRANVALKLTHLGLAISESLAESNLRAVVAEAARWGNFIRVDMEESSYVDATLRIYRALRAGGHENVGVVLQAYLYRTQADLAALLPLRPNLRLVKGAYLEPPSVAYPRKADVDAQYKARIAEALAGEGYTAVATHEDDAIAHASALARSAGLPPQGRFEFQMLYGVRPALQRRVRDEGYRVRIAAPFGRQWYPYFMRRLAERPANVAFLLRSLWRG